MLGDRLRVATDGLLDVVGLLVLVDVGAENQGMDSSVSYNHNQHNSSRHNSLGKERNWLYDAAENIETSEDEQPDEEAFQAAADECRWLKPLDSLLVSTADEDEGEDRPD